MRSRSAQIGGDDEDELGESNLNGRDFVLINATSPDDDGKDDGDGAPKKKNNSQKKFEFAIQNGQTVVLEDVGELLDPGLDPILQKAIYD